jgi:hypothetical protein
MRSILATNAGQLAPFCNGLEIEMEASLPLGLISGGTFLEFTLQLMRGNPVAPISDGILEVEKENDLRSEFRTKPSGVITALAWGQSDGITVVTVGRTV